MMARAKKATVQVGTMVLAPQLLTRCEALRFAAALSRTIGQVAHGRGGEIDPLPFDREFRNAACGAGEDLAGLLEALAKNPEAESFVLDRDLKDDGPAWLAIADLYCCANGKDVDSRVAPIVAVLRENEVARSMAAERARIARLTGDRPEASA